MINVTVDKLLSAKSILQELANTPMTAKHSFMVLRTLKTIDKEFEMIETTQRNLIEKFAQREEDGSFSADENGHYVIDKSHIEEYVAEMSQFLMTEIELDTKPLPAAVLDKMELTPNQVMQLEQFVDMDE